MKLTCAIILCLSMMSPTSSQIPNVYEFCNALLGDTRPPIGRVCDRQCPQGAQGKRGPEGRRGPPGPKGEQGEEGTCDTLKNEVKKNRATLSAILLNSQDALADLCGLGMKSGAIPDSSITASSQWDSNYVGNRGRLDSAPYVWIARPSAVGQWIEVDLGNLTIVTGVVTQGRPSYAQWMKSFKLYCKTGDSDWSVVSENGEQKIFIGNVDSDTKVVNILPSPITCSVVRLYPQAWNNHISMRMELLGEKCSEYFHG